jgi:hypothetical protein
MLRCANFPLIFDRRGAESLAQRFSAKPLCASAVKLLSRTTFWLLFIENQYCKPAAAFFAAGGYLFNLDFTWLWMPLNDKFLVSELLSNQHKPEINTWENY